MGMREHATTLGLVAAGVVCIGMMQKNVFMDVGGVVSRGEEPGRRLAGDGNEYAQAMRGIGAIFSETSETSVNGIPGAAQMIVTTVLILILGSLAAGAGIGGGGLFVPIYMVLLGAGPKGAVPLSKATILGGAIGNFLSIGPSRHPKAKRPLIDYESSTLMQSGELLGVVFGVLLNGLLPAICIVSFLVLILSYNAYKTINKALKIRAKETKAMNKAKEEDTAKDAQPVKANGEKVEANGEEVEADGMKVEADPVTPPTEAATELDEAAKQDSAEAADVNDIDVNGSDDVKAAISKPSEAPAPAKADVETGEKPVSAELQAILDADSKQYPVWAWALLAPMTAYTVAYKLIANAIRTSDSCSPAGYWLWYVTPIPVLGAFMAYTAYLLSKRHKAKLAAGFEYLTADMQWDTPTLKRFPATALLAGVTAGLLGIGGGMVIGPLFLSIGMEPQVGTSSCAFMILWTAFSGVVIYFVDDHLGLELMFWCVGFGFISGQIGQRLVNAILKKTGRPSYVVFLLGSIIGAACLAMATTLLIKMITGDYNADDVIEPDESVSTHLFYLGSGFGCSAPSTGNSTY